MTLTQDVELLRRQVAEQQATLEKLTIRLVIAETKAREIDSLRRAVFWCGGLIVAGAIGFGFSVLALIPA